MTSSANLPAPRPARTVAATDGSRLRRAQALMAATAATAMLLAVAGCGRDPGVRALTGGAIGAGGGAAVGAVTGLGAGTGAAIGGVGGAIAGAATTR